MGAASYVAACDDNIGAHPVEQANAVSRADNVKHAPAKNNKRERERERERERRRRRRREGESVCVCQ